MATDARTQWFALITVIVLLCVTPVLANPKPTGGSRSVAAVDAQGGGAVDPTRNVLDLVEKETKRQDDLRVSNEKYVDAELRHIREMVDLRADYDKLLRQIDTVRQEKVREVDILGGRTENDRSQLAIENTRKLVDSTAAAVASQLDSKFAESNKRIGALELAMGGSAGKGEGMDKLFGYIVTVIGMLGTFGIGIYITRKKKGEPA